MLDISPILKNHICVCGGALVASYNSDILMCNNKKCICNPGSCSIDLQTKVIYLTSFRVFRHNIWSYYLHLHYHFSQDKVNVNINSYDNTYDTFLTFKNYNYTLNITVDGMNSILNEYYTMTDDTFGLLVKKLELIS